MGAIPTQRETTWRAPDAPAHHGADRRTTVRATLSGSPLAPGSARGLVRAALREWAELGLPGTEKLTDRLADDAMVVVSELVTNAVVHAGTDVELVCRLEDTDSIVVEVADHHPSRAPRDNSAEPAYETPEFGRGLRLVSTLAEAWGVTYRTGVKTVWARLPAEGTPAAEELETYGGERGLRVAEILAPEPQRAERDRDWLGRGALSFLAEASDLLAGQLDEDLVAALAGQLIVPRLADWCAVWLEDEAMGRGGGWGEGASAGPRLARVWHGSENRIEELRAALEKDPPRPPDTLRPVSYPWPADALGPHGTHGAALSYRLIAGGRPSAHSSSGGPGCPASPTRSPAWSRTSAAASRWRSGRPASTPARPPSAASSSEACCPARSPRSRACTAPSSTNRATRAAPAATSTTSSRPATAAGASPSATSRARAPRPPW